MEGGECSSRCVAVVGGWHGEGGSMYSAQGEGRSPRSGASAATVCLRSVHDHHAHARDGCGFHGGCHGYCCNRVGPLEAHGGVVRAGLALVWRLRAWWIEMNHWCGQSNPVAFLRLQMLQKRSWYWQLSSLSKQNCELSYPEKYNNNYVIVVLESRSNPKTNHGTL